MNRDTDLHARCADLRRRSALLRSDCTALQFECARIIARGARARQVVTTSDDIEPAAPPTDPHEAAIEVLRAIRPVIDTLSLEWQIAVVKALTARTLVKAHEQVQTERTRTTQALTA